MQVVTTVKATIKEVHKALRLLNPNLPSEFVLKIDYNTESVDTESVDTESVDTESVDTEHMHDLMWCDHVQSEEHNQGTTEQQS